MINIEMDYKKCECGCGEQIPSIAKNGNISRFKHGHNSKINPPHFKGGKFITNHGYVMVKNPKHPRAGSNGYVFEHIVILEKHLGREITIKEEIHHINGDKQDNRPENLYLTTKSEHTLIHLAKFRNEVMSKRKCIVCNSSNTSRWHRTKDKKDMLCQKCFHREYTREYRRKKKLFIN